MRRGTHFGRWFNRADNDVFRAEALDLPSGRLADALADGQKPNHAGHADEDTQHGQERPQGMQREALEAELQGA
jgi:hypothetical protein